MKLSLMERFGILEVAPRVLLGKFPKLKKIAKRVRAKNNHGESGKVNEDIAPTYFMKLRQLIDKDDIVLVHSSMDGLESIGISVEDFMDFMRFQVEEKGVTFVLPCFPITNLKLPTEKSRPYDPKKTLCWTGMLPNTFIGDSATIRTSFPYNSLAAMGPKAQEMMSKDSEQVYVYDENSAWHYCLEHHAKILFVGVKASGSNTMAIHMTPDFMGDDWPVKNWWEERTYKVRIDGEISEKSIKVQADHWYQYCMEERTSGRLKKARVLTEESIGGCNLGVVEDCSSMMDEMVQLAKKGKLSYMIPKRYMRKR